MYGSRELGSDDVVPGGAEVSTDSGLNQKLTSRAPGMHLFMSGLWQTEGLFVALAVHCRILNSNVNYGAIRVGPRARLFSCMLRLGVFKDRFHALDIDVVGR